MSKEGETQEAAAGADASKKDPNADLYENRGTKKIVRLVTVMAYMFSVSFVAIVLSAYYLFLWEPPNPRLLRRPVHLSSEPEIQFLLADSPENNDSMNNLLSEMTTEQKGSNSSRKTLSGRVVDEGNDFVKNFSGRKHHRTLNESLALLRSSLVEYMRNKINNSKSSGWRSEEKTRLKNVNNGTKMMNRLFGSDTTSLTLNSSTIPGDEANNDRFTSTRNGSVSKNDSRSTENRIVSREQGEQSVSEGVATKVIAIIDGKGVGMNNDSMEESSDSLYKVKTFSNSNEGFVNISKNTNIDKSDVIENEDGQIVSNRSGFLQVTEFNGRSQHPRPSMRSSAKEANLATNFEETQLEKMMIKSTTVGQEGSGSPETVTTQRQRNLLMIGTEMNDTISSVSPLPIVQDLETNSSTENKDPFTEKQSKIT